MRWLQNPWFWENCLRKNPYKKRKGGWTTTRAQLWKLSITCRKVSSCNPRQLRNTFRDLSIGLGTKQARERLVVKQENHTVTTFTFWWSEIKKLNHSHLQKYFIPLQTSGIPFTRKIDAYVWFEQQKKKKNAKTYGIWHLKFKVVICSFINKPAI